MSRQELVTAYLDGRISRRTLIRRLIAGGVSTGAAISYAQVLAPERAGAATPRGSSDHYPLVDLRIKSSKLATVRSQGKIVVKVTSSEELLYLSLRVLLKTAGGGVPIGQRNFSGFLAAAGSRQVAININTSGLAGRDSARFYVQAQGSDAENFAALASAGKTLR